MGWQKSAVGRVRASCSPWSCYQLLIIIPLQDNTKCQINDSVMKFENPVFIDVAAVTTAPRGSLEMVTSYVTGQVKIELLKKIINTRRQWNRLHTNRPAKRKRKGKDNLQHIAGPTYNQFKKGYNFKFLKLTVYL